VFINPFTPLLSSKLKLIFNSQGLALAGVSAQQQVRPGTFLPAPLPPQQVLPQRLVQPILPQRLVQPVLPQRVLSPGSLAPRVVTPYRLPDGQIYAPDAFYNRGPDGAFTSGYEIIISLITHLIDCILQVLEP